MKAGPLWNHLWRFRKKKRFLHKISLRKIWPFSKFKCIKMTILEKKRILCRILQGSYISNYGTYVIQWNIVDNKINVKTIKIENLKHLKKFTKIFCLSQKRLQKNKIWIDPCTCLVSVRDHRFFLLHQLNPYLKKYLNCNNLF